MQYEAKLEEMREQIARLGKTVDQGTRRQSKGRKAVPSIDKPKSESVDSRLSVEREAKSKEERL